jgi:CBS domain-containing protein
LVSHYKEIHMQKIKEFMSRDVQVISPDASIREAAQQMLKGNFGMMPVGDGDRMIGAISDRDIAIRAVAAGKDTATKVRDVMSEGIHCVDEDASVADVARRMSEHQIRRMPVVSADKRLVGIVALGDFAVDDNEIAIAGGALAQISQPS